VLAVLSERDLVLAIWLPDPSIRREREPPRFRLAVSAGASATVALPTRGTPVTSRRRRRGCVRDER
jgi:hypothetical protein